MFLPVAVTVPSFFSPTIKPSPTPIETISFHLLTLHCPYKLSPAEYALPFTSIAAVFLVFEDE